MASVPTNKVLYARVKAEAKRKFKVWPSAYGSGWLVREYKRRGGKYRVTSKSRRKSTKKRRKSTKKRRKSTKKRRKSTKKRRRKSTKKRRRKSTKKRRRKSTKKRRRKSTKKRRRKSTKKKRRKSTKKRSRAPVKKTSPIKSYYKKSPIASKPKNRKKSKGKSRITIHRRPQLSREMSVENRNFYRPSARLPRPDERIPLELRRRSRDQYLARLSRPGAQQIPPLPPYRGSRAPKRSKKKPKRRKSKSKKRKSKRSIQSGLGRWFAEEWINVCKLPKIVPCGRNKAKWKNYPYCRPRRRINKGTPKTAGELSKAEIDRRCKRKKDNPKKKVRGKSRKKSTKKRSRAPEKKTSMPNVNTSYVLVPMFSREYFLVLLELSVSYLIPDYMYFVDTTIPIPQRPTYTQDFLRFVSIFYNGYTGENRTITIRDIPLILQMLNIRVVKSGNSLEFYKNGIKVIYDMRAYLNDNVVSSVHSAIQDVYSIPQFEDATHLLALSANDSGIVYGCVTFLLEPKHNYAQMIFIIKSCFKSPAGFGDTMISTAESLVRARGITEFHIPSVLYSEVGVPTAWMRKLYSRGFVPPMGGTIEAGQPFWGSEQRLVKILEYEPQTVFGQRFYPIN